MKTVGVRWQEGEVVVAGHDLGLSVVLHGGARQSSHSHSPIKTEMSIIYKV